jgi:malto-oligosyltrehalose trehalohydrolase
VVYELHVGTFTPEGTYTAAIGRLDYLRELGVTAIELLPLADFAGQRNWGYDGVLPFAPDSAYGTPEELKRFVDEAHRRGLMVIIDVVYNHFGPEGNFLHAYAPRFFNDAHQTPWGAAINYDGEQSHPVREFFIHNALYWLEEYRFDGLRMDAVHAIADESPRHLVAEIAERIAAGPGRERPIHIVLENEHNEAHKLARDRKCATAQWADDFHHGVHVLVTGESAGYYGDYSARPAWHVARALAEGFSYQGEPQPTRKDTPRGERSAHLPPEAFVLCLQNHDQVGNRAMGDRLWKLAPEPALRLASAALLLAPQVPMLFMGQEYGATTPFLFFCDFHGELSAAVRAGRRKEFAHFPEFSDPAARERIPDPTDEQTFLASKLAWSDLGEPSHAEWLRYTRELITLRRQWIVPRLQDKAAQSRFDVIGKRGVSVDWTLPDGARLHLRANFGPEPIAMSAPAPGKTVFRVGSLTDGGLGAWSGIWTMEAP